MLLDPVMWGFICSGPKEFPPGSSPIATSRQRSSSPCPSPGSWRRAPSGSPCRLPAGFGWFWAEYPGHVSERTLGSHDWIWESGVGKPGLAGAIPSGLPIRIFLFMPFIALLLVMVGATAVVALRSASDDAVSLATRLHVEAAAEHSKCSWTPTCRRRQRHRTPSAHRAWCLCCAARTSTQTRRGLVFILDTSCSTGPRRSASDGDPVVRSAVMALKETHEWRVSRQRPD